MNDYMRFIATSRYSRWIDELGRRETWEETVDRYIHYVVRKVIKDEGVIQKLRSAIINLELMPSMRGLMTAGEALDRDNTCIFNPVRKGTLVLTKEHGMVPIETLKEATVLNKDGRWAPATFTGYGEQDIWTVKLKLNSNTLKEVQTTNNHRWLLSTGVVKPTEALVTGDRIPFASAPKPADDTEEYKLGVIHGLIYGDGTTVYSCKRVTGYSIRLCGDQEDLLPFFEGYSVCYPPTFKGDPVVSLKDDFAKTQPLKELPSGDEGDDYLLGFIRGWMAADGYISVASQASIAVRKEGLEWLEKYSAKVGFVIQHTSEYPNKTNYGERNHRLHRVNFSRSSLVPEDFLIQRKRDRFKPLTSHFVVTEVVKTGERDNVYCAEVPDTNTFVLSHGLVTGNCAYTPVEKPTDFDKAMFILLCGTGVGFSVERQYVSKLPVVPTLQDSDTIITVEDSKEGWAHSLRQLISLLYGGFIPKWDTSKVRPAGARLKTFGGRASGPGPLEELFRFFVATFRNAQGRRLSSLECHDLMCKIGEIVVVGGVRRSAMISLSNLSDDRMRHAKSGQWWETAPHRALSNNSVAYTEKPDMETFLREWTALVESKSGERGIFSRPASVKQAGRNGRRDTNWDFGTNPCSEIILRPRQFCNLSELVARQGDTFEDLARKAELAAILGTIQATFTYFPYLGEEWETNTKEEGLLGVSLTGVMDCELLNGSQEDLSDILERLKAIVVETNREWAEKIGINPATACTCNKPSGTVSQLVDSSSGIHARHSAHYIRTVRGDNKDPITKFMKDQGIPHEPCVMKSETTTVFSFPMKSPDGAITRNDLTAIQQLELWMTYQKHWCEHKPSVTITVRDHEWMEVGAWVYKHFDDVSGVSFLPHSDHTYQQAPYQEIGEREYQDLLSLMPESVDWSLLANYEVDDNTKGSGTFACVSGSCEIVDL